ncbi:MAG: dihydrofolate reductase family protein [Coriobacteriales bacterium]|nr:dihydrofolate reductase family protein [Coriobacteriales bacterium]
MAQLVYSAIASLDGYVADEDGRFDWAEPDEEVHVFANELERSAGTYLYGRRMYEVMAVWETLDSDLELPAYIREFARIWKSVDKVVYSRTLGSPSTAKTRVEREFDPEVVRRMKLDAERDIVIGGPTLASAAIEAGLVDEYDLFVAPVVVGGGLRFLPEHVRIDLELRDERRFTNGMVFLRYRLRGAGAGGRSAG